MKKFKKLMKQAQLKRNRKKYFHKRFDFTFEVLNWLYENQKNFKNLDINDEGIHEDGYYLFDYPDYANMPKKMSNKIDGDLVDRIQDKWDYLREGDCSFKTIMELLLVL